MNDTIKERGAASVFMELRDGVITVTHGTDKVVLAEWVANTGDWDTIWATIYSLKSMA